MFAPQAKSKPPSWKDAIKRRQAESAHDVEFVPFSIEAGGVWGPAAKKFFSECLELADTDRNVDLYHWSSGKFSSAWYDTLFVLVAKGRAQVAVAAANGDWPKRTLSVICSTLTMKSTVGLWFWWSLSLSDSSLR